MFVIYSGQSESGKSTTVKNFQLLYSPSSWRAERITWRAVIYLNLVRSIRRILAALDDYHVSAGGASLPFVNSDVLVGEADPLETNLPRPANLDKLSLEHPEFQSLDKDTFHPSSPVTSSLRVEHVVTTGLLPRPLLELSMRLSPLSQIESILISALSSADPIQDDFEATHVGTLNFGGDLPALSKPRGELSISASVWMKALRSKVSGGRDSTSSRDCDNILAREDIAGTLRACRQDMISLWDDPYVRKVLAERRYRPQDSSGL